ncbi:MAG: hypothetical protein ACLP53_36550, partial [Isosphaeraceae bacterium]
MGRTLIRLIYLQSPGLDHDGRGEMPAGSLHRPMVSARPDEQVVRQRRKNDDAGFGLFDNSVDCTRQPENEKASKNEMDEAIIRR